MMKTLFLIMCTLMTHLTWAGPCPDDITPPVIEGQDRNVDCTVDVFGDPYTDFIEVTEESECGLKKVEIADWRMERGSCSDSFVKKYTLDWYAEDRAGNISTYRQVITVERPTRLDILVPGDTMVQCPAAGYDNIDLFGYPTINGRRLEDMCGFRVKNVILDTLLSMEPERCLHEVRKEWTIIDNCSGEIWKDTQNIVLIDTIRPIIACTALEDTVTLVIDPETCCAIYAFPEADAIDFCAPDDKLVFKYRIGEDIVGSEVALKTGTYEVSIIVVDPCNNADTCNYVIEVLDQELPQVECMGNIPIELSSVSQSVSVEDLNLVISDCSALESVLYRRLDQSPGDEAVSQIFTCDDTGAPVGIAILVTDVHGNENTIETCLVEVTLEQNVICPILKKANAEKILQGDQTQKSHITRAYFDGTDLIVHSDSEFDGLTIRNVAGRIVWERKWDEQKFDVRELLPSKIKGGIYFLTVKNNFETLENRKLSIF